MVLGLKPVELVHPLPVVRLEQKMQLATVLRSRSLLVDQTEVTSLPL
jgi:hypothetical protein